MQQQQRRRGGQKGRERAGISAEGVFVVVVVVVTDKDCGGNVGERRRRGFRCVMVNDVMPDAMYGVPTEVAGGCQLVRGRWQGWRHWRQWHWP
ncbi:MAG: hypothetical protein JNJ78_21520 [Anaerolineae bacterium]|nr:hypothetical protein [Anaerolineae bacterium]